MTGYAHDISRRLERQAERIADRAEAPLPKSPQARRRALTARRIIAEQDASNVVPLHPTEIVVEQRRPDRPGTSLAVRARPVPLDIEAEPITPARTPEPSPLTLHAFDLANGEAALVANLNAALIEGICEARALLADPYVRRGQKMQVLALLTKTKAEITRAHLKAQREASAQLDHMHMNEAERSRFALMRKAEELTQAGYGVTEPSGRKVIPRDRTPMDADGGDDDHEHMSPDDRERMAEIRRRADKAERDRARRAADHDAAKRWEADELRKLRAELENDA